MEKDTKTFLGVFMQSAGTAWFLSFMILMITGPFPDFGIKNKLILYLFYLSTSSAAGLLIIFGAKLSRWNYPDDMPKNTRT